MMTSNPLQAHRPDRRHLLCCGAAAVAGLFTSLSKASISTDPTSVPPGATPPDVLQHDLVARAFDGLNPAALWDVHTHLLGTGDAGTGCTVNPAMSQWWHPMEVARKQFILHGAGVPFSTLSVDRAYVDRLQHLAADFPVGARWLLFAFDRAHDDRANERPLWTTFHVPDAYAQQIASSSPQRFGWVASIHPYRADALTRLEGALASGAVAVKWLPSAMNIDLRDPRLVPFYARLSVARVPLIVHCGEEKAVPGAGRDDLGNPLLVRAALRAGVRVIVAHCASLGEAMDLDQRHPTSRPAFELFSRLMDEPAWRDLLLGDVSAVFQRNRSPQVWQQLLVRQDWHARLLHGSDYPLPGIGALYRMDGLVQAGLLTTTQAAMLDRLREHNPLMFDLVLKRSVRYQGQGFAHQVFDTRRHFMLTHTNTGVNKTNASSLSMEKALMPSSF